MQTFDQYLKNIDPRMDFWSLPDVAKSELFEFYRFLVFKYQQKPEIQLNEKQTLLSTIFQEAEGKLPPNYTFNREEAHER